MSDELIGAKKVDLFVCPRCGGELVLVDGWAEYGDQQVEVQRLGCYTCGYVRDEDHEDDD